MADDIVTVYVVTNGEYSSYLVCGIYSTMKKAEKAKDLFCTSNDIEEWTLDELPPRPKGMTPWRVRMDKDGNTIEIEKAFNPHLCMNGRRMGMTGR